MKLVVGLGNPGPEYEKSRHNLGFMCLNYFAGAHGIRFDKKQGLARTGAGEVAGTGVVVARPQTYMNRSGQSVARLVNKFNITLEDLIVIHDELDLPTGKIRVRRGGGSGGHKGVSSVAAELGSQDFLRIRVGIGRPPADGESESADNDIISYVLSGFTAEESRIINQAIPVVSEVILSLITEGLTVTMNRYN